jgi:methyl-accepting chemotaxis protein
MKRVRYDLYGAGVGLVLPLVSTLIAAAHSHIGLLDAQRADPLLWIVDTVPFVAGALGLVIRRQQRALEAQAADIAALEEEKRERLHGTAREVLEAAHLLLGNATSFTTTTAQTAASVRQSTATMTHLSHFATAAAVHAETVIGLGEAAASGARASRTDRETIDALSRALGEAVSLARAIVCVAQQQAEGIDGVMRSMNEIYLATEETQASASDVAAKARSLTDLAHALRGAVAQA